MLELMMKSRTECILYDRIEGDNRYIMTKDRHNWIWTWGNKEAPLKNLLSNNKTCYYTSIESLFTSVLEKRFKSHVKEFTLKNFKKSLLIAFAEVRRLGKILDKVNWDVLKRGTYCPTCGDILKEKNEQE